MTAHHGRRVSPNMLMIVLAVLSLGAAGAEINGERVIAADSEPGSWLTHGRSYAEDRQSPLTDITRDNVHTLGLAWYFDTGTRRGLEATPLVIDGVMFSTTSWSQVYAHDARTGEMLWHHDPAVPKAWGANACCDVVNRGVAAWGDNVFVGTLDGRLVALSRATGEVRWQTLTIDPDRPYTITGAPRAINGKIIIGNGGAEYGVRGYVSAYDAATGALLWRFFTVPGDPALPAESEAMQMAAATWSGDVYWKVGGGGTVWDSMAYDPELNLLYIGVGNGSPWNRWVRSPGGGDNLFLSSIVALDVDTGAYAWHYQTTPADTWDYTATQHIILADLAIGGAVRKVLMQAPKNGFFYVIDRVTGEFISAEKYVPVSWASHVDPVSGRPVETDTADHSEESQTTTPGAIGGHNWQPMAYNSTSGLVYIPAMEFAQPYSTAEAFEYRPGSNWNLGQAQAGEENAMPDLPDGLMEAIIGKLLRGKLIAWDPVTQQQRWAVDHVSIWNGGVLTTESGLVFQGAGDGRLVAYDAASGETLWETPTGSGVVAPPITYAIDGQQFVAVLAGWGGVGGLALPQIEDMNGTSRLLVYTLGGDAEPLPATPTQMRAPPPPRQGSEASIARGRLLYGEHCARCHGPGFANGGVVSDLRYMSSATHQIFNQIVLEGVYSSAGMVSFADVLNKTDADDLHNYLIESGHTALEAQGDDGWWGSVMSGVYGIAGELIAWFMTP